jgi:hypothetical protein
MKLNDHQKGAIGVALVLLAIFCFYVPWNARGSGNVGRFDVNPAGYAPVWSPPKVDNPEISLVRVALPAGFVAFAGAIVVVLLGDNQSHRHDPA